jgi:RNA polymerase sigma-70 factor, ECF subfamily
MGTPDLVALLLTSAPSGARSELEAAPQVRQRLQEALAGAADQAGFLSWVGARLPVTGAVQAFEALRLGDLLIAYACAGGDAAASRAVEQIIDEQVGKEARRLGVAAAVDEAKQLVRQLLFVAQAGKPAAIAQYSGRGDLAAWVRVIAVRELLRLRKAARKELISDDAALSELVAPGDDPELGMLRGHFKEEFRAAFADAVKALSERERNVLRQHFVDGLSIDEIAGIYHVHRATAARWVVKAKEAVGDLTRAEIRKRIKVDTDELNSILRLVGSKLDLSMRLLEPETFPED